MLSLFFFYKKTNQFLPSFVVFILWWWGFWSFFFGSGQVIQVNFVIYFIFHEITFRDLFKSLNLPPSNRIDDQKLNTSKDRPDLRLSLFSFFYKAQLSLFPLCLFCLLVHITNHFRIWKTKTKIFLLFLNKNIKLKY